MRKIMTDKKYNLVKKFLIAANIWNQDVENFLNTSSFEDQDDGGMGSFSICNYNSRTGTRDYAEAEYIDQDGKQVFIALIGDEYGYPTDMDFWKVDSSPIIEFPDSERLLILPKC